MDAEDKGNAGPSGFMVKTDFPDISNTSPGLPFFSINGQTLRQALRQKGLRR